MPKHPPRSQPIRKKQILDKRIDELIHAVKHDYTAEKIESAAENVRYAYLKVCKGTIQGSRSFTAEDEDSNVSAKAKREFEKWQVIPTSKIVEKAKREFEEWQVLSTSKIIEKFVGGG